MRQVSPRQRLPRRVLLGAIALLILWLGVASVGGVRVGQLSQLQKNDAASFLPASAESTQVLEAAKGFTDRATLPVIIVAERDGALTPEDLAAGQRFAAGLPGLRFDHEGQRTVGEYLAVPQVAAVPSKDGKAMLVIAQLDNTRVTQVDGKDRPFKPLMDVVRERAKSDLGGAGLTTYVTGPAGFVADLTKAFAGIDGLLLIVALGVVLVILLIVYRSPILPIAVLLTSVFGLSAAGFVVYQVANAGWVTVSGQSQGILSILVVGAATDYSLLMVSRYKEELHDHESTWVALKTAWRATVEPILASAATVILGLLALMLGQLKGTSGLGPVGALGILGALFAALTLLPALLVLGRRWIFWPVIPRVDHVHDADSLSNKLGWRRVARMVGARPRTTWVVTTAALLVAAAFLPTLKTNGIAQSELFLTKVDSVEGQKVLAAHFDAGSGSPIQVLAPRERLDAVVERLRTEEGISSPAPLPAVSQAPGGPPAGAAPSAGAPANAGPPVGGPPGSGGPAAAAPVEPKVVGGKVLVQATLTEPADSAAALDIVERVRTDLRAIDPSIGVGGQTAQSLDTRVAADRDLMVVGPTIILTVFLVLCILLRALVAPLLLMVANLLSFGATMGLAAVMFNHVFKFVGGDPTTVLYGFVFLVALGVDYSIFLMTRAREETARRGHRAGVLHALSVTGGVITSAGVVLAATFGALIVIPLVFLAQIAFIVAAGVLIDTLVVRSLLVPAASVDIGPKTWWPGRLARGDGARAESAREAPEPAAPAANA